MFSRAAAAVLTAAMLFALVWSAPTFAHNVTTYVASLTAASDLVFYSSGNLYVSGNTIVSKVGPGGGPVTTYASGF